MTRKAHDGVVETWRERHCGLASLPRIRSEQARIYRDVKSGRIPAEDGTKLTWILNQIRATLILEKQFPEPQEAQAGEPRAPRLPALAQWLEQIARDGTVLESAPVGADGPVLPVAVSDGAQGPGAPLAVCKVPGGADAA